MKLLASVVLFFAVLLMSCSDDTGSGPENVTTDYNLKVNEFVAAGSEQLNEYAENADWFEIYNASDKIAELKKGSWFFSDDTTQLDKWVLPIDTTIEAGGFLIIWCDDNNKCETEIHTSFKLGSAGETICISCMKDGEIQIIDSKEYFNAEGAISYGRFPDGSEIWEEFETPTPGTTNVK